MRAMATAVLAVVLSSSAAAEELESSQLEAGEPVLAYNLAVVPLYTKKAPPYDDYTVLEEAQREKKVRVRELGEEGEVSQLRVSNKDARPLYLLGGEMLLGGKQDRMVVDDTIVEAGKTRAIDVRCVEAGRWSGGGLTFQSGEAVAHPQLRQSALFGSQGEVWQEVARKSAASGVSSSTGTYRRVFQDAALRERIKRYLDEVQEKIPRSERLSGMAVAINGELEVVDVFSSPQLYAKLERKLLASYVLAALERQPSSDAKKVEYNAKARSLKKKDVDAFMGQGMSGYGDGASSGPIYGKSGPPRGTRAKVFKHEGKPLHGSWFGTAAPNASQSAK